MSEPKPIFVATHPRACSTAFERVFMTCRDSIACVHEPFGDAWYYGPELLAHRFKNDERTRQESGFQGSTYKTIMDNLEEANSEGKRVLIKDMAQYFFPPEYQKASVAPSLMKPAAFSKPRGIGTNGEVNGNEINGQVNGDLTNGLSVGGFHTQASHLKPSSAVLPDTTYDTPSEPKNPTIMPNELLKQFHFAFLIRHPRNGIPSYFRCCIPPLQEVTGFHGFDPAEAGYKQLRELFDYLRQEDMIGPDRAPAVRPRDWVRRSIGRDDDDFAPPSPAGDANGASHLQQSGPQSNAISRKLQNFAKEMDGKAEICVIDADDMLDYPKEAIASFCESVGIAYSERMLYWDTEEEQHFAKNKFEKWKGFHEDAISSRDLKPRQQHKNKTDEEFYTEWVEKYGKEEAELIKRTVEENVEHYEYLKQFAVDVPSVGKKEEERRKAAAEGFSKGFEFE